MTTLRNSRWLSLLVLCVLMGSLPGCDSGAVLDSPVSSREVAGAAPEQTAFAPVSPSEHAAQAGDSEEPDFLSARPGAEGSHAGGGGLGGLALVGSSPEPRPSGGHRGRPSLASPHRAARPAPAIGILGAPTGYYRAPAAPVAPIVAAPAALRGIDPNGRFATTYRPGRGHLAGFEASLARGELPPESRELVGDVGSAYAPEMVAPTDRALAWQVDLERAALPPSGGHTHLRIALRSSVTPATARPPMSVHVVFDVSQSMEGNSIVNARRAAQELVGRLDANDVFSLVAFGATASVRVPEGPVGPRRQQILDTIGGLQLEGGTNISGGLDLGYGEAARGPQQPEWVKLVMLISDGRPNAGDTDSALIAARAARAFQTGVQTSSFGVGDDYDGNLMSGIAEQGAGGYYYVRDSQGIAQSLATEFESRLQPVAQGVEVRVRLRPDVLLTQTYGSRRLDGEETAQVRAQELAVDDQTERRDHIVRDRANDAEGGMRFFIPGFARDDQHVILLGVELPAGVGARSIATVELRYKDRLTRRNVTDERALRASYADSNAASVATADPSVLRTVHGFDAGETLLRAARLIGDGDSTGAFALLGERASLLRAASSALHDPRLAADATRVDRLRNLAGGSEAMSAPLVLALLLDTSGRGMLH